MGVSIGGDLATTIERKAKHASAASATEDTETNATFYTNSQSILTQTITQEKYNIVMKGTEELSDLTPEVFDKVTRECERAKTRSSREKNISLSKI